MGHGKPGKSKNFRFLFSRLGNPWNFDEGYEKSLKISWIRNEQAKVMENCEKSRKKS